MKKTVDMRFKSNFLLNLTLLAMIVWVLSSCGKDDDAAVKYDKTLLVGTWRFQEISGGDEAVDAFLSARYQGLEYTLNSDGTYSVSSDIDESFSGPDEGEFDMEPGTWMLQGSTLTLSEDGSDFSVSFEVKELSSTTMILFLSVPVANNVPTSTWIFSKQ